MKAAQARLERIEGSLLWIARELGGDQGLAALSRELKSQRARVAELGEALVAHGIGNPDDPSGQAGGR